MERLPYVVLTSSSPKFEDMLHHSC